MNQVQQGTAGEDRAEHFVSRLLRCPLDDWRRAAAVAARDVRAEDCVYLATLVAAPESALVAWRLRDMVCTCVHRFCEERFALTPREQRSITEVTERTAEALLVGARLPADTFERLSRSFEFLNTPDQSP